MQLLYRVKMSDDRQKKQTSKVLSNLIAANSGWKAVYEIGDRYFIEDIIAYAHVKNGIYYELIPLTISDVNISQSLQDYTLKDGYIGLINPQNELIVNDYLEEEQKQIDIQKIKKALGNNRYKLD
jgi:hypothetical protein